MTKHFICVVPSDKALSVSKALENQFNCSITTEQAENGNSVILLEGRTTKQQREELASFVRGLAWYSSR